MSDEGHGSGEVVADGGAPAIGGAARGGQAGVILWVSVFVALVVVVVHWPVLSSQAVSLDDEIFLDQDVAIGNPGLASVGKVFREVLEPTGVGGYAQPVAKISLMADVALGGTYDRLEAFHRTNLLLHVMNTVLVVVLVYRLFGHAVAAALCGLLFGVHPLTVEVVAWVAQRKAILAASLGLWSLVLYVWYVQRRRAWVYIAALAAYALATMSKPSAVPIAGLLLVLDWWPLGRFGGGHWREVGATPCASVTGGPGWRRLLVEKVPFFAVAFVASVVILQSNVSTVGLELPTENPVLNVPLIVCHKLAFCLGKVSWPVDLSCYYPPPRPLAMSNPDVAMGVAAMVVLAVAVVMTTRWTRGVAAGVVFFVAAMSPMLGAVSYSWTYVHDNYIYFPAVGLVLMLAWAARRAMASRSRWGRAARVVLVGVVVCVIVTEAVASRRQFVYWRGRTDLYERMLVLRPDCPILHSNLGVLLVDKGDLDGALERFEEVVRLAQDDPKARSNLGNVLYDLERLDDAIAQYREAVRLDDQYVDAWINLGAALTEIGEPAEAAECFQEALRQDADHLRAHYRLGDVYVRLRRFEKAVLHYSAALRADPADMVTRMNLGIALRELGRFEEAIAAHRAVADMDPQDAEARFHLGLDYEAAGDTKAAVMAYREVVAVDPAHARAAERIKA